MSSTRNIESASSAHLRLLEQQKLCDVTFLIGPEKRRIKCHKAFLAARSPVFAVMFSKVWNTKGKNRNREELIPDTNLPTFLSFLKFMYVDKFAGSVVEITNLLYLAHKYDVEVLVNRCTNFLATNFELENSIEVYQAARLYDREDLKQLVEDYMARCFNTLKGTENFNRIDEETLISLLKRDDINISECDVFVVVVGWGEAQIASENCSNRCLQAVLQNVLPHIRFPTMTLPEFASAVRPTALLPPDTMLDIFTYFGSNDDTRKEISEKLLFNTEPRKRTLGCLCFYSILDHSLIGNMSNVSMPPIFIESTSFMFEASTFGGIPMLPHITGVLVEWPTMFQQSGAPPIAGIDSIFRVLIKSSSNGLDEHYNNYINVYDRVIYAKEVAKVRIGENPTDVRVHPAIELQHNQKYSIEVQVTNVLNGTAGLQCVHEDPNSSASCVVDGWTARFQNIRRNTCPGANTGELHFIRGLQLKFFN